MGEFRSVVRLAHRSLGSNGVRASLAKVPTVIRFYGNRFAHRGEDRRFWQIENEDSFDATHGTDTSTQNVLLSAVTDRPTVKHATSYWPSYVRVLHEMFAALLEHPEPGRRVIASQCVFVDIGCGKGRTVLVGSELDFKHLHGVDFAPELIQIAERNLALYQGGAQRHRVTFHVDDVLTFEFPEEPLLIYMFHPFNEAMMRPFVDRLVASVRSNPRPLTVMYLNPQHEDVLLDTGGFDREGFAGDHSDTTFALYWFRG